MLKRAARFLLFCGLGIGLALLVAWISDQGRGYSDLAQFPAPLRGSPAATAPGASSPPVSVSRPTTRAAADAVALEPADDPIGESATAARNAAPVPPRGTPDTTAARPSTPPEAVAPSDEQSPSDDDDERLAAWCFFTTLEHRFRSDTEDVFGGSRSALIDGVPKHAELRVNAVVQGVDATPYRGSRVELSVHAKTGGETRLFLQSVTERELAQTSNGSAAAPSEKTFRTTGPGWTRFAIVAEVPRDAAALYFGFGNFGTAALRLDDAELTKVSDDTPVTELFGNRAPLFIPGNRVPVYGAPANLDFELTNGEAASGGASPPC